jgi:hypothetical protein
LLLNNVLKQKNTTGVSSKQDSPDATHSANDAIVDIRDIPDSSFVDACRDKLKRAEKIRIKKLKLFERRKAVSYPLFVILTPICMYLDYLLILIQRGNDEGAAGITFLIIGGLWRWMTAPKRQYAKAYKTSIFPEIVKVFGGLSYDLKGKIPMELLKPSNIVPSHDRYKTEDYFSGHYKGVKIKFSEIHLEDKRKTKNGSRYVTVFKGLAILLDMNNKKFYGHTILDKDKSKLFEWFKQKTNSGLKRANLVDPEFEDIFDAYTNDQVEARYLVDPKIMERYKDLHDHYDGRDMNVAYYENKVLILIASKTNHFEPSSIYIPATDEDSLLMMKKEIQDILTIVDYLDLYDPDQVHSKTG